MLVPPELVDHILSFLRGDKPALEACLKVHPVFSSIAEPYLYADIIIRTSCKTVLSEFYKLLSENPHILNFLRTFKLEIRRADAIYPLSPHPEMLLIMSMLPRMANLMSLTLADQWPYCFYADIMSNFETCLQQLTIEELCLESFRIFPSSILDGGKTIKRLTLSNCRTPSEDETILTTGSPLQSLETLIIRAYHNSALLLWAGRRATSLTKLELRDSQKPYLREFAAILAACSKTLTRLHLDIDGRWQSIYRFNRQSHSYGSAGRWIDDLHVLPFTLSAHGCLKEVSIIAQLHFNSNARIHCALPAILRLIKTAPSVPVVLSFRRNRLWGTAHIEALNLSPLLERFRFDFPTARGVCPRIDLHINHDFSSSLLTIPDVLETTDGAKSDWCTGWRL